jgi:eukaryotic-like serine/threonine-protein kinase
VAYAHSKGIIHRDLKCDNVILGDYGEVVAIDWGLAKQYGRGEVAAEAVDLDTIRPAETVAGHILGTPAYMAPEQAAGESAVIGPATDVYGLSAILYEILCGQPPFTGASTIEVLKQVQFAAPVRPSEIAPGIPATLEQICLTGLAKLPAERHASAEQLAKAVGRPGVDGTARLRAWRAPRPAVPGAHSRRQPPGGGTKPGGGPGGAEGHHV